MFRIQELAEARSIVFDLDQRPVAGSDIQRGRREEIIHRDDLVDIALLLGIAHEGLDIGLVAGEAEGLLSKVSL